MEAASELVGQVYGTKDPTYLELYGGSVGTTCLVGVCVALSVAGSAAVVAARSTDANWAEERCKPHVMPFAGLIHREEGETVADATRSNFQSCMAAQTAEHAATQLAPTQQFLGDLTAVFSSLGDSMNAARVAGARMRSGVADATEDVMGRAVNVAVPIQQMALSTKDAFGKMQGVLTASLMAMLGTYDALKALMGAILGLVIKTLVVFSAVILGLWANPATWPVASAMSVVYLGISVPLAVIVGFMEKTLHVKTDEIPKLRCFAGETRLHGKRVDALRVGDYVNEATGFVTATFRLFRGGMPMYRLASGHTVSATHLVCHGGEWLRVDQLPPHVAHLLTIPDDIIHCIDTTTGYICDGDLVATDWSERIQSFDETFQHEGYPPDTLVCDADNQPVRMDIVQVGDVLANGTWVWGTVHLPEHRVHLMTSSGIIPLFLHNVPDYPDR